MFVLRPKPDDWVKKQSAGGYHTGYSPSWWDKGALVVDDHGPAVVDAEGRRVPIPIPPGGAVLHRVLVPLGGSSVGVKASFTLYYVCDRDQRLLAWIPGSDHDGFTKEQMIRFAEAAGFEYQEQMSEGRLDREFPKLPDYMALSWCVSDDTVLDKRSNPIAVKLKLVANPNHSPYRDGRTYPPMDPSYLRATPADDDGAPAAGTPVT